MGPGGLLRRQRAGRVRHGNARADRPTDSTGSTRPRPDRRAARTGSSSRYAARCSGIRRTGLHTLGSPTLSNDRRGGPARRPLTRPLHQARLSHLSEQRPKTGDHGSRFRRPWAPEWPPPTPRIITAAGAVGLPRISTPVRPSFTPRACGARQAPAKMRAASRRASRRLRVAGDQLRRRARTRLEPKAAAATSTARRGMQLGLILLLVAGFDSRGETDTVLLLRSLPGRSGATDDRCRGIDPGTPVRRLERSGRRNSRRHGVER